MLLLLQIGRPGTPFARRGPSIVGVCRTVSPRHSFAAGADVHAARVRVDTNTVVGVFELTDGKGRKIGPPGQDTVRDLLRSGVTERPSRWRRKSRVGILTAARVAPVP